MSVIRENLSEYSFRELSSYQDIMLACEGRNALSEGELVKFYNELS